MAKIESFCQVSAQNQTTEGLLKNLHAKKIMIILIWILLVTKISNWRTKTDKKKLKIENWCIDFFRCLILSVAFGFPFLSISNCMPKSAISLISYVYSLLTFNQPLAQQKQKFHFLFVKIAQTFCKWKPSVCTYFLDFYLESLFLARSIHSAHSSLIK